MPSVVSRKIRMWSGIRINRLENYIKPGALERRKPRPRAAPPLALAEIRQCPAAAALGELAQGETSRYAAVRPGTSGTLDIIFSWAHQPEGEFSLSDFPTENTQIFLNVRDNDCYQRGIPGLTGTIEETAHWLQRAIDHSRPNTVRTIGGSMGGYAALLFGHLLSADAVYCTGPFVRLGEPFCRSVEWYKGAHFDPKFQDISRPLPSLRSRCAVVFPVYDFFDYHQMQYFAEWPLRHLFYCPGLHPGGGSMDWDAVMASERPLTFDDGITKGRRYPLIYSLPQMERIWDAYGAIRRREHSRALRLIVEIAEIDPMNHGVTYRLGVQQALLGDLRSARVTLRKAMAGIWRKRYIWGRDKDLYFGRWRELIARDYSNVVELAQLKELVGLFHQIWGK